MLPRACTCPTCPDLQKPSGITHGPPARPVSELTAHLPDPTLPSTWFDFFGSFRPVYFILTGSLDFDAVFSDLTHQYQLHDSLHRKEQEPVHYLPKTLPLLNFFLKKLVEAFCRPIILILFLLFLLDLHTSLHPHQLRDIRHLLPFSRNAHTAMSSVIRLLIALSTSAPPKPKIQHKFKPPSHSAAADDVLNDSSVNDVAKIDPEMGQTIRIGRKFGRLFELINLSIPRRPTILPQSTASVASQKSLELWHSCLGSDLEGISILKQDLNHPFEMKDLGTFRYFLGLEVSTASNEYYLSQAKYGYDLFCRAGLTNSKTTFTPLEPNVRFTPLEWYTSS
ncbi:hypothetical protein RJ639_040589 [Escallonia herrerae]|uniref:Reverse transcriptase Ty1/copia-type domain-containing protein n=1 Tax=Escallonia herrerae TaxID=1293975 RepID=A0AA89B396_9ASTE|nr:hypothetical protein RJ639_040589 [Escallonia herrerae]